jgi:hypothetical protein
LTVFIDLWPLREWLPVALCVDLVLAVLWLAVWPLGTAPLPDALWWARVAEAGDAIIAAENTTAKLARVQNTLLFTSIG